MHERREVRQGIVYGTPLCSALFHCGSKTRDRRCGIKSVFVALTEEICRISRSHTEFFEGCGVLRYLFGESINVDAGVLPDYIQVIKKARSFVDVHPESRHSFRDLVDGSRYVCAV